MNKEGSLGMDILWDLAAVDSSPQDLEFGYHVGQIYLSPPRRGGVQIFASLGSRLRGNDNEKPHAFAVHPLFDWGVPVVHILLIVLDLGGTCVFAISGAAAAVKHRLDIFGVMVLAFAAGNAGGITRDLLIGAVPPAAIANWSYLGVSILAGLVVYFWYPLIARLNNPVLWFDAVGLAFFAVAGAEKALVYHLNPTMAALLGMLTGIGGGMLRDVLVNEIPTVLRADLYALAALAGAVVVVAGHLLGLSAVAMAVVGGLLCFVLRFMAIRYRWHLPAARHPALKAPRSPEDDRGR